jgi:hypothetical protein
MIFFARTRETVSSFARMKVTGLAIVPPPAAAALPKVTPELLASVLARYSRSNEGLGKIPRRSTSRTPTSPSTAS